MNRTKSLLARPCALCGQARKLKKSHIVPQFVYRWAKVAAGDEAISDGPSREMLCAGCEDRFSSYESEFARQVFHPFAANAVVSAKYSGWLRKFAASVCWRILATHRSTEMFDHTGGRWTLEMGGCQKIWKDYLVGKRPDVGANYLHLLRWNADMDQSTPEEFVLGGRVSGPEASERISNSQRHTIEMDVFSSDSAAFVYAKLGPIILVGSIAAESPGRWQGERIHAEGKLKFRDSLNPELHRVPLHGVFDVPRTGKLSAH